MKSWEKWLSISLFVLGTALLLSGLGLWAHESLLPAWRFDKADTDGDGIVVAGTLESTPTVTSDTEHTTASPAATSEPTVPADPSDATTTERAVRPSEPQVPSLPSPTPPPTATPTPSGPPPASAPPSRLVVPSIDLDTSVETMGWDVRQTDDGQTYSDWILPEYAAGWHQNSALPGHGSNVVLSGHNNLYGEVFRYLEDVEPGDTATLYVDGTEYRYVVAEKYIVKEKGVPYEQRVENAQFMAQTDEERLTLIGCWPYETNTHRLILVARPVPSQDVALNSTQ